MRRRPHPEVLAAYSRANAYRIHQGAKGFNVWRFFDWDRAVCGWRLMSANFQSREAASLDILRRLGLEEGDPSPPPPEPTIMFGFLDFTGPY